MQWCSDSCGRHGLLRLTPGRNGEHGTRQRDDTPGNLRTLRSARLLGHLLRTRCVVAELRYGDLTSSTISRRNIGFGKRLIPATQAPHCGLLPLEPGPIISHPWIIGRLARQTLLLLIQLLLGEAQAAPQRELGRLTCRRIALALGRLHHAPRSCRLALRTLRVAVAAYLALHLLRLAELLPEPCDLCDHAVGLFFEPPQFALVQRGRRLPHRAPLRARTLLLHLHQLRLCPLKGLANGPYFGIGILRGPARRRVRRCALGCRCRSSAAQCRRLCHVRVA